MTLPLVTVGLPVFEASEHLEMALNSVLAQTYSNIEILVCDDASTDKTIEVAERVLEGCCREYRVLKGEHLGMVGNWNRCLKLAQGAYLKFLFHDDWLEPECVEKLVSVSGSDIALSFAPRSLELEMKPFPDWTTWGTYRSILESQRSAWEPRQSSVEGLELLMDPSLLDGRLNRIGEPSSVMLNRSFLDQCGYFDSDMGQFADVEMWYRWIAKANVGYHPQKLSTFRIHGGQQTGQLKKANKVRSQLALFYRKIQRLPLSPRTQKQIKQRLTILELSFRYPLIDAIRAGVMWRLEKLQWALWAWRQGFWTR